MYQVKTIAPGVRAVGVKAKNFKTNVIDVEMALPLNEKAAVNSVLINLLSKSSKEYPDLTVLNQKLDELYGASLKTSIFKDGDAQIFSMKITCLDDRFALEGEKITEECIELLAGLIFNPNIKNGSFGKENLTTEKRLLKNKILTEQDDKRAYALEKCIELMCPNEPYGRSVNGTLEEVDAIRMTDVFAAWKELVATAVFQITVVGNITLAKAVKPFTAYFKDIDREPAAVETVIYKKGQRFRRGVETSPVNQGKLVIGYRAGIEAKDENYYPIKVMTDIFGGGTYSKLFANVREKMSLAYYCSARYIDSKGLVIVQSGIDTEKEKEVSNAIVNQLNDIRNGKFDDELLEASKRSFKESSNKNSPSAICSWYSSFILDEEIMTPEQDLEGYLKVTKEEVCEAAKNLAIDKIFMLQAEESGEN